MFTRFMDMHSGGGCKEKPYEYIYIEAPLNEAVAVFYNRFGHNPHRVTCTCCGEDYSVSEEVDLAQASGYERNCAYAAGKYTEAPGRWGAYQTVEEYAKRDDVLIISADEIKPEERTASIPVQGYVWRD